MQFRNPVQVDVVESQGTGGNAVIVDAAWARDVGPGGWSQCLLCGSYRLESAPHGTVSITNDLSDPQVPVEGRAGTFAFLVVLAEDDTIRLSLFGYQDSWTDDSQSDDAHPGGSHRGGSHRDEFENDGRALADTCVRLRRSPEGSEREGPPSRGSAPGDE